MAAKPTVKHIVICSVGYNGTPQLIGQDDIIPRSIETVVGDGNGGWGVFISCDIIYRIAIYGIEEIVAFR